MSVEEFDDSIARKKIMEELALPSSQIRLCVLTAASAESIAITLMNDPMLLAVIRTITSLVANELMHDGKLLSAIDIGKASIQEIIDNGHVDQLKNLTPEFISKLPIEVQAVLPACSFDALYPDDMFNRLN